MTPTCETEHFQAEALTWSAGTAGRRQCRPLGGASPLSVFEAVEAKALLPLPDKPFVLACWSTAAVRPDIHIKVGRTLYSVPWKLIGRKVDVRSTATMVQVFHGGDLVKTHAALPCGSSFPLLGWVPRAARTPTSRKSTPDTYELPSAKAGGSSSSVVWDCMGSSTSRTPTRRITAAHAKHALESDNGR
ncbi:hypothetical protein OHB41_50495 [Streptomyces sp. NBC_01571]|uniref:Mu transposase domain-containing protein n=1 Tax=Streptomyces sp. NBC_01571 TaxID=2975883 RepID=UPI00225B08C0|nr:hypothetical protein [Streptomyces sp. NBC_01571]MCX4581192.1 hypothetical protein [Streptomyces sp. NBC_01571]